MKRHRFKYTKKKDGETSEYNLIVTSSAGGIHFAGVDLNKLTESEKSEVINIQRRYEEDMKPFMKAYRMFLKENIVEEIELEIL